MKSLKQFFPIFFGIVLSFTSCETKNTVEQETPDFSQVVENIEPSQFQNPVFLNGKFEFAINQNKDLYLFKEEQGVKHTFVLQGVEEEEDLAFLEEGIEQFVFLDKMILLSTKDDIYFFGVDPENSKKMLEEISVDGELVKKIYGYGLSYSWLTDEDPFFSDYSMNSIKKKFSMVE